MTTEATERDLIEEVEELLAKYPRGGVTFPQPSRSRTRDVLNDYGCGCQVRRDGAGAHLIHTCATHNSAPELLRRLVEEVKRRDDLIGHMWVHSGYKNNGYLQMTAEQKLLYDAIIQRERGIDNA